MINGLRWAGLGIVFLWFFVGGVTHFTRPEFFLAIMPPYVPFHLVAVYLSGALEILFALGILLPVTRAGSGWALIALTVAVTPANVHMWLHPELFPDVSETALTGRLVLQVFLMVLIWWSTRAPERVAARSTVALTDSPRSQGDAP